MDFIIGILFLGGLAVYVYFKFIQTDSNSSPRIKRKNTSAKTRPLRYKPSLKVASMEEDKPSTIEDNVKSLKSTLRQLRKQAEKMEQNDDPGLDSVLEDIRLREEMISEYEVEKLVEKVKDLKTYRALVRKYDNNSYGNVANHDEIERISGVFEEAVSITGEKVYKYILQADIDTHTPLDLLIKLGKALTPEETREIQKQYSYCEPMEVTYSESEYIKDEIEGYAEELKEEGLQELIKFRKIIENNSLTESSKQEEIDKLVDSSKLLRDVHFHGTDDGQYYYDFIIEAKSLKLEGYNIPMVDKFVKSGYDTIEKIIEVPEDEIRVWYGVGSKTLNSILIAQKRARERVKDANEKKTEA